MIIVRISFPVDSEKAEKVFDAAKKLDFLPDRAFTYPLVDDKIEPTQVFTFHVDHGMVRHVEALLNAFAEFDIRAEVDGEDRTPERPVEVAPAEPPAEPPKAEENNSASVQVKE